MPRTVTLTLATKPLGLQVTLDAQPLATPASLTGVVGIQRTLGVVSPQTVNGVAYTFKSWSDGGAATHTIATPTTSTTYTATYGCTMGTAYASNQWGLAPLVVLLAAIGHR